MSDPHQRARLMSDAMHREVARRLRSDPATVVARALANLARWQAQFGGELPRCYEEWQPLLAGTVEALIAVLEGQDERAQRMRSSSPFTGLLTTRERAEIMRSAA